MGDEATRVELAVIQARENERQTPVSELLPELQELSITERVTRNADIYCEEFQVNKGAFIYYNELIG